MSCTKKVDCNKFESFDLVVTVAKVRRAHCQLLLLLWFAKAPSALVKILPENQKDLCATRGGRRKEVGVTQKDRSGFIQQVFSPTSVFVNVVYTLLLSLNPQRVKTNKWLKKFQKIKRWMFSKLFGVKQNHLAFKSPLISEFFGASFSLMCL